MTNKEFFKLKFGETYTPDYAECENDIYTFESLEQEIKDFWDQNKHIRHLYDNVDNLINDVISILDWQSPSTILADIDND